MELKTLKGPFVRSNNETDKMMKHLFISLVPIILFAFYKNGILPYIKGSTNILGMLYPLILIIISTITSIGTELLYFRVIKKRTGKELKNEIRKSYSIFPGLFLALILPINTPISILILGCMMGVIVSKILFGGFGNNIFNPALICRLFIITSYAVVISSNGGYLNSYEIDAISTATPLSNLSAVNGIGTYETIVKPFGSLMDFFIGFIPGSLGETSALLCIIAFIYLTFTKTIKWRIPILYIGTVFIMTFIVGLNNGLGIWYPLFQILSGGLMFGAVFMATDPVTSPVTVRGQVFYGISLGILTVLLRYFTPYPESVLTSILTMNMLVFIFDRIGSSSNKVDDYSTLGFLLFLIFSCSITISTSFDKIINDQNFAIISKRINGNEINYVVIQKGNGGNIKARIVIDEYVKEFEILEHFETANYYKLVNDVNYIDTLIKNYDKLDTVDTVSGATITSTALKKMLINTYNDYLYGDHNEILNNEEETFTIEFKETISGITTYIVSEQGFADRIKIKIMLENDKISNIEILSYNDTCLFDKDVNEYYPCTTVIDDGNYINKLITNQNDVDSIDAISGATLSSRSLKNAVIKTMKDYFGD